MSQKIILPQEGEKITLKENGALNVPANPIIPFIEGDGIGPDIWRTAKEVLEAAVAKAYAGERQITWLQIYAGAKANKIYGENIWLPRETLEAIREYLVAIKGPLTTPVGGGIRSLNVALRQELDLYVCQRPVRYFRGVSSPLRHPEKYDYVIFRENSEDIYAGIEWQAESPEAKKIINFLQEEMKVKNIRFPESSGIGIKPISREGTERLIRAAIQYAIKLGKKKVTLVHKGNIMKFTEGAFCEWSYQLAEREYAGQIEINDVIADAFLQQILTRPDEYSIVATTNLNGDYISDALAACVGGIGLAPGANINYETGTAIFEATHGTAPKYAGLDKVNPGSLILSGVMMFEYLGWPEGAEAIIAALQKTIEQKIVTYDLARLMEGAREVKCSEFANAIVENL